MLKRGISSLTRRFAKGPITEEKPPSIGKEQFHSVTGSTLYSGTDVMPWEELSPWSTGWQYIDKMTRDETIRASLSIIKMAVTAPGYTIQATDPKNAAAAEAASWWEEQFKNLPGSASRTFGRIMTALEYGYSVTERVLRYDGSRVALERLKPVRPHDIVFVVNEYGHLHSVFQILQRRITDPGVVIKGNDGGYRNLDSGRMANIPKDRVEVPAEDIIHFTHGDNFGDPRGKTALVYAYRSWWSKDNLIKFWNMGLEKFGVPWVVGEHANLTDDEKREFRAMIEEIRGLSQVTIPKDRAKISLIERAHGGGQNDPFEKALNYHDMGITRAMLMPSLLGFGSQNKTGSYAQSETHFDVFMWVVDDYGRDLEETINEQIMRPVNRLNFPEEIWPTFKFNPRTEEDKQALAKIWTNAVDKGSVAATIDDEDHFRELTGFPEISDEEKKRRQEVLKKKEAIEVKGLEDDAKGKVDPGTDPGKGGVSPPEKKPDPEEGDDKDGKKKSFMATDADYERLDREERTRVSSNVGAIADTIAAVIPYLEKQVTTKTIEESRSIRLPAKFVRELRTDVNGMMTDAMVAGMRDVHLEMGTPAMHAKAELDQFQEALTEINHKHAETGEAIIPHVAARQYLDEKAFYITGVTSDNITKSAQQVISEKFQNGMTNQETIGRLHELLSPYAGGTNVAGEVITPYRLETIVRTNQTDAYNRGRLAQMADPALKDFITAYRFSSILDERTTDQCAYLDGKDFAPDDAGALAYTPPLHFNCRSILTPVTVVDRGPKGEKVEPNFITDKQKKAAANLIPTGFGGKVPTIKPPKPSTGGAPPAQGDMPLTQAGDIDAARRTRLEAAPKRVAGEIPDKHAPAWVKSMTEAERQALLEYTRSNYGIINDVLRYGDDRPPGVSWLWPPDMVAEAKEEIKHLLTALGRDTAPTYNGTTYRAMQFLDDNAIHKFVADLGLKKGGVVNLKGFTSTSIDRDMARAFASNPSAGVWVEVRAKSGVYLDAVSANAGEQEVLIPHNALFKVLTVKKTPTLKAFETGDFAYRIVLEEII